MGGEVKERGWEGGSFKAGIKEGEEGVGRCCVSVCVGWGDLTTCSVRKALFFCTGPLPWATVPGQTQSPH